MTDAEQRARVDMFYCVLELLREQNDAGEISGLMILTFSDTNNWCSSERSGNVPRGQRVRDSDELIAEVKRNPNFTKGLYRGAPRPVASGEKARTDRYIRNIEREREHRPIEGAAVLVYKADGTTLAYSFSNAPQAAYLQAFEYFAELAWGQSAPGGGEVVNSGGPLDYGRLLIPTPEAEAYARQLGDKLPNCVCRCGVRMQLVSEPPGPYDSKQLKFACKPCSSWQTRPFPTDLGGSNR